jgi:hypothetical protein
MIPLENIKAIRFIAMIGILLIHTSGALSLHLFDAQQNFIGTKGDFLFYSFFVDLAKISTIIFFIISGYLYQINEKKYLFKKFVLNKYKKLLIPYFKIFVLPIILFLLFIRPFFGLPDPLTLHSFLVDLFKEIFFSNYWFVPTLFIYFILNYFIPFRYVKYLLPVAIVITLFYSLNIYYSKVITYNATNALGFLSFFLLGRVFTQTNFTIPKRYRSAAIALVILAFSLCLLESWILSYSFFQVDAWNTLRFGNVVLALIMLVVFKDVIRVPSSLLKIDTYFLYLFHPHLLRLLLVLETKGLINVTNKVYFILYLACFLMICLLTQVIYKRWNRLVDTKFVFTSFIPVLKSSK